ncbi:ROK family transcriptional regulator [Pendulispora rubella]|uniref:ROK family transcriptional regulator n=1 Tax=Pendulispora rubella TaxID=2741070 RepID=A0ABZ2LBN2_9BACT
MMAIKAGEQGWGVGPVRHGTMRDRNLALVLDQIVRHQRITRARLAEMTGFTKTTVSNLLAVLVDAGLVREGGILYEGERRGRPGTAVSVHGAGAAGLGLEINVDYLAACVVDLARRVRYRHVVAADHRGRPPEAVVESLARLAEEALGSASHQGLSVAGATVALPGLLDRERGFLRRAPNLGWSDVPVQKLLQEGLPELRLAVEYDNEANLAALGELWFGAGAQLGDFVHVSGEIGIGAGIVVGGNVFRGAHGFAGELGHIVVEPGGARCGCGARGCLEQMAGQEAILRAAGLDAVAVTSAASAGGSIAALVDRLAKGDDRARSAVRRAGKALGATLAAVVNLFDPDAIVLGGIFSPLAPWAKPSIEKALAKGAGTLRDVLPPLVVSELAGGAAVLGAAGSVASRVTADPALLLEE